MVAARQALLRLHRWAGLGMAAFLTLAGLTGAVIAFQAELDSWLNPTLYQAPATTAPLSPGQLTARFTEQEPRAEISYLAFRVPPGQSVPAFIRPLVDPASGAPFHLGYDQVFLDPATGAVLGAREWGACCLAPARLIPFLYRFHYTLAAGEAGEILMGSVAILWALDCFVGLLLTLPRGGPFLMKWRAAWTIKRGAGSFRLTLDLHRAGALWLWLALLLMAISGIALTLEEPVFRPVLGAIAPLTPSPLAQAQATARGKPVPGRVRLGFDRALAIAAAASTARGWNLSPGAIFDAAEAGAYAIYFFDSPSERGTGLGRPVIYLDDASGALLRVDEPGHGTTGDAILSLQYPLHSGQIAGLPGRIAIALLGLAVAMLSVTGVLVWDRKRRARRHRLRIAAAGRPRVQA